MDTLKRMKGQEQSTAKNGKPRGYFPDLRRARPRGWADSVVFICSFSAMGSGVLLLTYLLQDQRMLAFLHRTALHMQFEWKSIFILGTWPYHAVLNPSLTSIPALGALAIALWTVYLSCRTWRNRRPQEEDLNLSRMGSLQVIAVLSSLWITGCEHIAYVGIYALGEYYGMGRFQKLDLLVGDMTVPPLIFALVFFSVLILGRRIPDYLRVAGGHAQICLMLFGIYTSLLVVTIYCFFISDF